MSGVARTALWFSLAGAEVVGLDAPLHRLVAELTASRLAQAFCGSPDRGFTDGGSGQRSEPGLKSSFCLLAAKLEDHVRRRRPDLPAGIEHSGAPEPVDP